MNQVKAQNHVGTGAGAVTVERIDYFAESTYAAAETLRAMFLSIERLIDDDAIKILCRHGARHAFAQAQEIDILRESALKEGVAASGPVAEFHSIQGA